MRDCECNVRAHGNRQIELQVVYPLDTSRAFITYSYDLYMFCPYQLRMNSGRHTAKDFLANLLSYTRFSVPRIPLSRLADLTCELSPLSRIARACDHMAMASQLDSDALVYELRMFTNILHRQAKESAELLRQQVHGADAQLKLEASIESFLTDLDLVLALFRHQIHPRLTNPNFPETVRLAANWADERVSLSSEKHVMKLYEACQAARQQQSCRRLHRFAKAENDYRLQRAFKAVVRPGAAWVNEQFLYHTGMLKKWAEGCMYMSAAPRRLAERVSHLLMGAAAAVAMAFALAATFLASELFSQYTLPWAVLIVVGYVFKDRLKEGLRALFGRLVPQLVADKDEDLIEPTTARKVGSSRLRIRFLKASAIASKVRCLRYLSTNEFRSIMPDEDVIEINKISRLQAKPLVERHTRLESVTEILRFKLDDILSNMDDPADKLYCFSGDDVQSVQANRVYHLSLVVRLRCKANNQDTLLHYRAVLNRMGILRLTLLRTQ